MINMTPFKNLPAKERGIDTTREFVVVADRGNKAPNFDDDDILELIHDDDSINPLFKRKSDGKGGCCSWFRLAYAPTQPEEEPQYNRTDEAYMEKHTCISSIDSTDAKLAKIIEWLYLNEGMHTDRKKWREALIKMLKETI